MAPKELTRFQISSRITYESHVPAFLARLQKRTAGIQDDEGDDPAADWDGTGRPPIPQRPPPPQRPDGDPGSADEESGDEKPVVVVLKEGKHLTEREAENIKRREKGLSSLPDPSDPVSARDDIQSSPKADSASKPKSEPVGLSFSSSKKIAPKSDVKRKAVDLSTRTQVQGQPKKKKVKKDSKTLLSFGDDT